MIWQPAYLERAMADSVHRVLGRPTLSFGTGAFGPFVQVTSAMQVWPLIWPHRAKLSVWLVCVLRLSTAARLLLLTFSCQKNVNLVVCVDLSLLGGTSSAGLVPALLGLHSAMFETLGHEVLVPKPSASNEPDADDLNPLWDPCGIFFNGVEPMAALSGYTEGYLATLSQSKDGWFNGQLPTRKANSVCWVWPERLLPRLQVQEVNLSWFKVRN